MTFDTDPEGLRAALRHLQLDIRMNTRNEGIEIARSDWKSKEADEWYQVFGFKPPADGFVKLADGLADRLLTYMAREFKKPSGGKLLYSERDFRMSVSSIAATRRVNPVEVWLRALPPWDKEVRLSRVLTNALDAEDNELNRAMGRAFFIGAVARALDPGCKNDIWPILFSRGQGKGKSTFCNAILPPDRQSGWFSESLDMNDTVQRRREAIDDAWIVEYSELQGLSGRRTEAAKSWIGRKHDRYRLPWHRTPDTVQRSFVVIATGNDQGNGLLPADSSGDRRFVAVNVPDTTRPRRVTVYLDSNRTQLWAEATEAYLAGEQWWFSEDLERQQALRNAPWQRSNEAVAGKVWELTERSLDLLPRPLDELMLSAGVVKDIEDAPRERALQMEFAEALRKHGWVKKTVKSREGRQRRLWQPPTAKTYCQELIFDDKSPDRDAENRAPCGEEIEDGPCPNLDYHLCVCGSPRVACTCPKGGAGATPADGGVQATMPGALDSRIDRWADVKADLRRPGPGRDLIALTVAQNIHRGLVALKAAGPELYLSSKHVAAMGGAEALLDTVEKSLVMARETDWPLTLRGIRSLVEPRRRVWWGVRAVARVLGVRI